MEDNNYKDMLFFVNCFWDMPNISLKNLHHFILNYEQNKNLNENSFNNHLIEIMIKRVTKKDLITLIPKEEYDNIQHLFKDKLESRIPNPLIFRKLKD